MAIQTGDQVLFVKVATANDLPATPDDATIYFVTSSKAVYLGATLIANGLVRISNADYQQLTPEQQGNGTIYYRYDATDAGSFDVNVTQSPSTTNAAYRILLSGSADNVEHTEGAGKSGNLTFNPSTNALHLSKPTYQDPCSVTIGSRVQNSAVGSASVLIGQDSVASGDVSFSLGISNTASAVFSVVTGVASTASGPASYAQGSGVTASGNHSHAEGAATVAAGGDSHAEGTATIAACYDQHVFGAGNIEDTTGDEFTRGTYIEIVGNGDVQSEQAVTRSNARTLDWDGNEVLAGKLTVGAGPTNAMDVATKQYVDNQSGQIPVDPVDTTNLNIWIEST